MYRRNRRRAPKYPGGCPSCNGAGVFAGGRPCRSCDGTGSRAVYNVASGGKARFNEYRDIDARFDSPGTCGHAIRKGDRIGWARRTRETQCAECWAKWRAENADADAIERGYMPTCL